MATETLEAPVTQQAQGVPVGQQPMPDREAKSMFDDIHMKNPVLKGDYEILQKHKAAQAERQARLNPKPAPKAEVKVEPKAAVVPEAKPEETIVNDNPDPEKPEEKEEEVVTEPATEEQPPTDQDKSQKRWGDLKKIEKDHKRLSQEAQGYQKNLQERETKISELETQIKDLQQYKTELDEAYKELEISRIEGSRKFKDNVTMPRAKAFSEITDVATRSNVDPKGLFEAIMKDVAGDADALTDFMESNAIHNRWQRKIEVLADNMTSINQREADLRESSKGALEAIQREEQEQFKAQQEAVLRERSKAAETVSSNFSSRLKDILPENHGLDFEAIRNDAQGFDKLDEGTKVYASYAGYALPKVIENFEKVSGELKEAKAELARFRNGSVKTNTGTSAPVKPVESKTNRADLAKMSVNDYGKDAMSRLFPRMA